MRTKSVIGKCKTKLSDTPSRAIRQVVEEIATECRQQNADGVTDCYCDKPEP